MKSKLPVFTILFLFCLTLFSYTMSPVKGELNPLWARRYGEERDEVMYRMREMPDGGFMTVGYKYASSGYGRNIYIVRTDYEGKQLWFREFGAKDHDYGFDIIRSRDGFFIIVGSVKTSTTFDQDIYLIKINDNGGLIWDREVHASGFDLGYAAVRTPTGDILIAGSTKLTAFHREDATLTRTNSEGTLLWRKIYGGYLEDEVKSIVMTPDDGYLLAGRTQSYGKGGNDVYLIKTDSEGKMLWNKTYGGKGDDVANEVIACSDGNYVLVGTSDSFSNGESDVYAIKVDPNGEVLWQKIYGGESDETGSSVVEDRDRNLVITGTTFSYGAGSSDALVIKCDKNGSQILLETVGGEHRDTSQCIVTSFGTYYVLGGSIRDVDDDFYLVKFSLIQKTLNVTTSVGETFGGGTYYKGANVPIGIVNDVVMMDNFTRYLFDGWVSDSEYGYNGEAMTTNISLIEDVQESANWKKQYLVEVFSEGNGNVTGGGWFDEGTEIIVSALPVNGYFLSEWVGEGKCSYSGSKQNLTLIVDSPIRQLAYFLEGEPCLVEVSSKLGEVSSPHLVVKGTEFTLSVDQDIISVGDGVRYVFDGWRGDGINTKENPLKLTAQGDIKLTASWRRQFLVTESLGLGLGGWYTEGTILLLRPLEEGIIPKKVFIYMINDETVKGDSITVLSPVNVTGEWQIDVLSLAPLAGGVVALILIVSLIILTKRHARPVLEESGSNIEELNEFPLKGTSDLKKS